MNEFDPNAEPTVEEIAKAISHPVLTHLNNKLENLQSQLTASQDSVIRLRDKYRSQQSELESLLKELLDDEEIDVDVAKRIADIFDSITLTKQVDIQFTITATATVEVPYGTDDDTVGDNIFVERVEFYSQDSDYDILESDHDVDDWNVR